VDNRVRTADRDDLRAFRRVKRLYFPSCINMSKMPRMLTPDATSAIVAPRAPVAVLVPPGNRTGHIRTNRSFLPASEKGWAGFDPAQRSGQCADSKLLGGFPSISSLSAGKSTFQPGTLSNSKADTSKPNGRHEAGRRGCHCHISGLGLGFDGSKTCCEARLRGADLGSVDVFDLTPLGLAASHGHEDVCGVLISRGDNQPCGHHSNATHVGSNFWGVGNHISVPGSSEGSRKHTGLGPALIWPRTMPTLGALSTHDPYRLDTGSGEISETADPSVLLHMGNDGRKLRVLNYPVADNTSQLTAMLLDSQVLTMSNVDEDGWNVLHWAVFILAARRQLM